MTEFDDERWYWAAGGTKPSRNGETEITDAADRFVIARGQRELWARVRAEVSATEHCAWNGFGPKDGNASLADFLFVMVEGREMYGANFNKVVTELAQVPAFAKAIVASPASICAVGFQTPHFTHRCRGRSTILGQRSDFVPCSRRHWARL